MNKRLSIILFSLIVLIFIMFGQLHAQEYKHYIPNLVFVSLINSPAAIGIGKCTITLKDEEAVLYNPACLGLLHLNSIFAITLPSSNNYYPPGNYKLKTFSISSGIQSKRIWPQHFRKHNFCLALAYSKLVYDYGDITGHVPGYGLINYHPSHRYSNYSISAAYENSIRIGLGYTHRIIRSSYYYPDTLELNSYDFGIILELPIAIAIKRDRISNRINDFNLDWEFTPSIAYTINNFCDESQHRVFLPQRAKFGISIYNELKLNKSVIISARLSYENEQKRIIFRTFLRTLYTRYGAEIGFGDAFFIRFGRDNTSYDADNTSGYGFKSRGIVSWLSTMNIIKPKNRLLNFILDNFNISYDYASCPGDNDQYNIHYLKFGISL
ncbi:MAG: hypothetical protein GY839_10515 [candidate division Zixibacteria bacterium]|nr:hypothetical protein [candidate division Zixibacteria bacterium]